MLKSYEAIVDQGKIQWLSEPPAGDRLRVLVVVEQSEGGPWHKTRKRFPPPELKGSVQGIRNPEESVCTDQEWELMLERTARQIEGDQEAFQ
jgi:hypothetical protein